MRFVTPEGKEVAINTKNIESIRRANEKDAEKKQGGDLLKITYTSGIMEFLICMGCTYEEAADKWDRDRDWAENMLGRINESIENNGGGM